MKPTIKFLSATKTKHKSQYVGSFQWFLELTVNGLYETRWETAGTATEAKAKVRELLERRMERVR